MGARCGSGHGRHTDSIRVTPTGRIGPLQVGGSSRVDVVRFLGKPESVVPGEYASYGRYEALGYGCGGKPATGRDGFPACATVLYIRVADGRLEEFYTAEARYVGPGGIRPHMNSTRVERRLHRRVPRVGCIPALTLASPTGQLTVDFRDFRGGRRRNAVEFFVVMGRRYSAGVFDCIDS